MRFVFVAGLVAAQVRHQIVYCVNSFFVGLK